VYKEKGTEGEQWSLSHQSSSGNKTQLLGCIEQNVEILLININIYIRKVGMVVEGEQRTIALEILQETIVQALEHADRFVPTRQPLAWLLGISMNLIKRKKVEQAKHARREIFLGRLVVQHDGSASEEEILDRIFPPARESEPEQALESEEEVNAMLSLVSFRDQQMLRLAVIEELNGESLAQRLGISVEAARMRLSRSVHRLRLALLKQRKTEQEGERHE